jgi:curved DNA-binding protein CbpA
LGVPENADEQEIKMAYRKLAKRYHPDMNAGDRRSEERFKEIAEAYDTLSDPILRRAYDLRRMRNELYAGRTVFYEWGQTEPKEKKDPRRKEYAPEDLERARVKHRKRIFAQSQRRKKLLAGMIITFVLYLFGTAFFQSWIQEQRKKDIDRMNAELNLKKPEGKKEIQDLDSPYELLFGPEGTTRFNPNRLVIFNYLNDAVVCAVSDDTPHRTIRNEFIHGNKGFVMPEMPNGSFYLKIYVGLEWDSEKAVPDGRKLGGFRKNEKFYRVVAGPFTLQKPTFDQPNTNTVDTVWLDPSKTIFREITREEFFQ